MTQVGRPRIDDAKRTFIGLRLNDDDTAKLDAICKEKKMSRSEAIRFAIQEVYADKGKR